ncbi:hypothetical protein B0H14DRAFT_3444874 [Mycena olivaceomarginata]|nr:hypothetical protein B0H14DRAFT_3444874 [Mycena olivaceomarginata]
MDFCFNLLVFVIIHQSLCNLFARKSPPEPIPSVQVLNIHGVAAGCSLIFRSQTILIRRRCSGF